MLSLVLQRLGNWILISRRRAYGLAVLVSAAAFFIRFALDPELGNRAAYSLFAFAVLITAVFGGTGPAILTMVLSVTVVDIYIFRPRGSVTFATRDVIETSLFVAIAIGMIWLNQIVFGARRRAEKALLREQRLGEQLKAEEATQRAILATIPDAMVVIDARGIIRSFSAAAESLFGYTADDVCGQNVKLLMPQPFRAEHDSYIARYQRTGEARIIGRGRVVTGLKKDGTTFPMDLAVGETKVAGEKTFVGFVRDLSAKLENERRMQSLQSDLLHASRLTAMGEMAAALAHELNQPLTAIANYTKAARRTLGGAGGVPGAALDETRIQDIGGMLDKAAAQSIRASQIIKRLRDFVEHREVSRGVENPTKVVEEAMALALVDLGNAGIRVRSDFDHTAPAVYIDKIQIQQVLVNLIRNSLEAMQTVEHRELAVTVGKDGEATHIAVCDTGPGLAPEVAGRLFQPFVTTKKTGMGVGLSICHSIMEAHGGRIWVTPNAATGVTFHLSLPAASDGEVRAD